jgi:hypothetical protein
MTETNEHAGWVPVILAGAMPMDVAGTMMTLIGSAWPTAVIDTTGRHLPPYTRDGLVMLIDPRQRARKVSKKAAREIQQEHARGEGEEAARFLRLKDGTLTMTAPEELMLHLGDVAHVICQGAAGDNYIEWEVRAQPVDAPEQTYVLSIARSKGQTPHALRTRAEAELDALRARVRALADSMERGLVEDEACASEVRALIGE